MTARDLKSCSLKDLAQLAKRHGVARWQTMKKEELIKAVLRASRRKVSLARVRDRIARGGRNGHHAAVTSPAKKSASTNGAAKNGTAKRHAAARVVAVHANGRQAAGQRSMKQASERIRKLQLNEDRRRNLATEGLRSGAARTRDRLVALVRDPYWLHAYWELSRHAVERARMAMGQDWHSAQPVLRLLEVCGRGEGTSTVERLIRDIPIHGGVNNWYVDVKDPPKSFRLDIGYLSGNGRFFSLARSNIAATPRAGTSDTLDSNWSDVVANFDKIYAMNGGSSVSGASAELEELLEERLRRPLNSSTLTQYAVKLNGHNKHPDFTFELDAELIVFGTTEPDAQVTLQGEPIEVRPDGTFTVRYSLPNCRQVIPAVARSRDGLEQRTIVLAVERNTKTMEPVLNDGND